LLTVACYDFRMVSGSQLTWWECPPVIRTSVRNYVLAILAVCALGLGFILSRDWLGVPYEPYGRYGGLVITLVPLFLIVAMFIFSRRRLRRHFHEARGRLCTHCAYNLTAMSDHGTCPECGKAFDAEADKAMWEAAGYRIDD